MGRSTATRAPIQQPADVATRTDEPRPGALPGSLVCTEAVLEQLDEGTAAGIIALRFERLLADGWAWRPALLTAARTDVALP